MSDSTDNLNQVLAAIQQLQLENDNLRESLRRLQERTPMDLESTEPNPLSSMSMQPGPLGPLPTFSATPILASTSYNPHAQEPKVSLPDKFDGTRTRFRGFINQIKLIIRLQPQRYPDDFRRVGLVGTLLSGPAQAWFAPLIETSSPLLDNFDDFLKEFEATFGETDRRRSALTRLYSLHQGMRAVSVYASEFRQLACDVQWDGQALCDHFRRGLRSDIKNLMLNFPEPTSLSEAISQAVTCDNRLFELRQEERTISGSPRRTPMARPQVLIRTPTSGSSSTSTTDSPIPMEIDRTRLQPLTDAQRHHRRVNGLCLYCGASTHLIRNCPIKGTRRPFYSANTVEGPRLPENDNVRLQ